MKIDDWKAVGTKAPLYREIRDLDLESNIAELDTFGFTVVPPEQVSDGELIDRLRQAVLRIAADRNGGVKPDLETGSTHSEFVSPTGQHLFYLMEEDRAFQDALLNPVVLSLVTYLMGDDVLLSSCTSMVKGPGQLALPLHSDQPIHPIPNSLVCNATYLLSDYSRDNGALCFWPGSHRFMRQPTKGENFSYGADDFTTALGRVSQGENVDLQIPDEIVPIEAPAGSLVVWHGNTWHGAFNRCAPGVRMNTILYFCHPSLRPQEAYRELIAEEVLDAHDDRFSVLMGKNVHYGWATEGPQYAPGSAFVAHRSRPNANVGAKG